MKFKILPLCLAASVLVGCGGDDGESNSPSTVSIYVNGVEPGDLLEARVIDTDGYVLNDIVFTWFADGVEIADETAQTFEVGPSALGSTITVSASFTDLEDNEETPVAPEGVAVPLANFAGSVELSGTAGVGEVLTATISDLNEVSGAVTYVWERDDVVIAGADAATYTTVDADIGRIISVTASYTDDNGFDEAPEDALSDVIAASAGSTQVAEISDTNLGGTSDDTGEIRYDVETHQTEGRMKVSFLKTVATSNEGGNQDAYITLYGSSGSSSQALIDLRIQEDQFLVRGSDPEITYPFTPDQWYDVEIRWDVTASDQLTLFIDGVNVGGTFESGSTTPSNFAGGVEKVQFRFSDNSRTVPDGNFYVDDFVLYSDAAGTTEVFSDDFEGYDVGTDLDEDQNASSPYLDDTVEAVVAVLPASGKGPGNIGNQIAQISDTNLGGTSDDTGEIRYDVETHQTEGRVLVSFLKNVATSNEGGNQDAYITLYGSSGSSSQALVDLRIQEDQFLVRGSDPEITYPFSPDQWYDVEIMWDVAASEQVTIAIDGVVIGGGAFESGSTTPSNFAGGVEKVQFRFSDNSRTVPDGNFFVDDFALFSDQAGTTVVFSDDFEDYEVNTDLDEDQNPLSPYLDDTVEAIVTVEQ